MCGFAGFIDPRVRGVQAQFVVRGMAETLVHRGPDDCGDWQDDEAGFAIAHRRLSIIDLSPLGRQPMRSTCDRYVIAFNGEIYNFVELRAELVRRGHRFRGHSDTEVLLAAASEWGVTQAIERANGMFAIAIWDRERRRLTLARDRLGEKPLYYGVSGGAFLFGSELKALRAHPAFCAPLDRGALTLYLRHNFVPSPWSIYEGIRKLSPGCWVEVDGAGAAGEPHAYWSVAEAAARGRAEPFVGSEAEGVAALEAVLAEAVESRMMSDVPLGAFLSGGIDSSLVTALMVRAARGPVRTFSIGFGESAYDEAPHARAVAAHLGTDHTELYVTAEQALAVVPELPLLYDEPFADSSQIPTVLLARLTRQHVTVALSGDGGDELFAGYDRYLIGRRAGRLLRAPRPLRAAAASLVRMLPPPLLEAGASLGRRVAPGRFWPDRAVADRLYKAAELLAVSSPATLYLHLMSHWKQPARLVVGGHEPATRLSDPAQWPSGPFTEALMIQDATMYLPDDVLTKVDRATMAASLEARPPLLDHRVVEFAWRLPLDWKLRGATGKWLLKQVLDRHVPRSLVERPKTGFGVPLEMWLRGPLRDWAEAALGVDRMRRDGVLDAAPIRIAWQEHVNGRRNWHYYLWTVLIFQGWLEAQAAVPAVRTPRPIEVSA